MKKETFVEAMKKSPEEKLAWFLLGNEDEETLKDVKKAVREDNKELLCIYGLRKFFYEYAKKIKQDENRKEL